MEIQRQARDQRDQEQADGEGRRVALQNRGHVVFFLLAEPKRPVRAIGERENSSWNDISPSSSFLRDIASLNRSKDEAWAQLDV
jgi:hypothetical protein